MVNDNFPPPNDSNTNLKWTYRHENVYLPPTIYPFYPSYTPYIQPTHPQPCETCNRCQTCGRGVYWVTPKSPYYYPNTTWVITTAGSTSGAASANIPPITASNDCTAESDTCNHD